MTLIERLQGATGPDRALDAEIELSRRRFLFGAAAVAGIVIAPGGWLAGGNNPQPIAAPHYTGSLDSAMTLVPEGWRWLVQSRGQDEAGCFARLESPDFDCVYVEAGDHRSFDVTSGRDISATSATPAIALCIAALKARGI
jgi:hypothetical protein